jgi:Holliday junction DNA helicase RuvB
MFKSLFKRIDGDLGTEAREEVLPEDKFFPHIVGYSDIKRLFLKYIIERDPVHLLLTGPPASSQTVFLLEMLKMFRVL